MVARKNKAKAPIPRSVAVVSPEGANVDPLNASLAALTSTQSTGLHMGVTPLTYHTLFAMARTPVVASIISTRMNQVSDFANRLRSQMMNGWSIQLRQPNAIPSRVDRYRMDHIASIIDTAGGQWQDGGFEQILRSMTYYTLTVDQAHIQPIKTKMGKPCAFRLLDPTTIRRNITLDEYVKDGKLDYAKTGTCQYINNRKVAEFAPGEISWSVRNSLPGITTFGYGYPELAMLVTTVTALLNAQTHNSQIYTTGYHGNNMVTIKSLMGPERFKAFENSIQAMLVGVRRNKSVPVVQLNPNLNESIEVHPFGKPPGDMEFANWINWLVKLMCALYAMDPVELGFTFGDENARTRNKSDISPQDKIVASKERGLRPLLRWISRQINEAIIWPYWPDYQFEFYGFDSISESQRQKNLIDAVQNYMSVNEVRSMYNLPPWKDPVSNRPLNASYQMYQQKLVEQGVSLNPDIVQDDVAAFVGGRRMNYRVEPA
jgi:hypothetical protein